MSISRPSTPLGLDTVLNAARQQRADHLALSFNKIRAGERIAGWVTRHQFRWLALGTATLLSAVLIADDRHRGLAITISIFLASIASSIAGFAFSAICGALLFHLSDHPVQVVQIMMTCSIANQAVMTWTMRRDIEWRALTTYFAGGALGLTIGVWVLLHLNHGVFTHAIGVFLLAYGAYMFCRKPVVIRWNHPAFELGIGFLGGITGGAAGLPGMPVTIWCGMKGWDKRRQRAVFQPFILIVQIAALLAISLARQPNAAGAALDPTYLLFIPASLLGTALGFAAYERLSDWHFARAINLLLIVSGLSFVV